MLMKSAATGAEILIQFAPPSVVRKIIPAAPTTQHTLGESAKPVMRFALTPLACVDQVLPLSVECSIEPASPTRHNTFPAGGPKIGAIGNASARTFMIAVEEFSTVTVCATAPDAAPPATPERGFALAAGAGAVLFAARRFNESSARKLGSFCGAGGGAGASGSAFAERSRPASDTAGIVCSSSFFLSNAGPTPWPSP